jgi:hypothetical protein
VEAAEAAAWQATAAGGSGAAAGYEGMHGGGWEEEDDGGAPSSSPSIAAVTSDPSDVVVGEQGPDAGPIMLVARRRCSSADLASSNITKHVRFLIFTSLSKYFIASCCPISRCLFCLVKIASSTFIVGVYIVQTVSYGRRMNRGQTAS